MPSQKMTVYPEQAPYVGGNKIWLLLPDEKRIVVEPQARSLMKDFGIDEAKFIQKLKDLMADCLTDLDAGYDTPASCRGICVSKSSVRGGSLSFPTLTVELKEFRPKPVRLA